MTRAISLAVFVTLMLALWLTPDPPVERLAAIRAGSLLTESVTDAAGESRPLWQALLESSAATEDTAGTVLRIGEGVLEFGGGTVTDPDTIESARRSVARGLRSLAAVDGSTLTVELVDGPATGAARMETLVRPGVLRLRFRLDDGSQLSAETEWYPAKRSSLFPPLLAIALAIVFRRPVIALFAGVFLGAVLVQLSHGSGLLFATFLGGRNVFSNYFWTTLIAPFRYQIILFVIFMLAMVGVITRAGGIRGVMDSIATLARDAKRTQVAAYLTGLAVFFDDYTNTILVGSTMRPLFDRFRISREKLAYIVDSTAAPVAGISVFSTWIAFEVSTFSAQLPEAALSPSDGYSVFFQTLPYRFYCLFTLIFVAAVVFTGRDFGPMRRAETRARGGKVLADGAKPMVGEAATQLAPAEGITPRASVALVPLAAFVGVTLLEIVRAGNGFAMGMQLFTLQGMADVLGAGSGSIPLMLGSLVGLLVAAGLALAAGLRIEILGAAWSTLRSMGIAIVILYLAWMIGGVCNDPGTASYLAVLLHGHLSPVALPLILFALAGVTAFSTGSSWSTMTILLPLVVGLAYGVGETAAIGGHLMMVMCIGAVLEGAIFGDHCSPVSDTTVLSSIASASDHIDHVRTQAPYAIVTMLGAMLLGYLPSAWLGLTGRPWLPFLCLALGAAVLVGSLLLFGRKSESLTA